jgi:hypothetical protein
MGRPRRRWEDNIKMDLQEVGCGVMDWIELAQNRDRWRALVNAEVLTFIDVCGYIPLLVKLGQKCQTLYVKTCTFMISSS